MNANTEVLTEEFPINSRRGVTVAPEVRLQRVLPVVEGRPERGAVVQRPGRDR